MLTAYWEKTWGVFLAEVERKPTRTSRGRQKMSNPKPMKIRESGIGRIKPPKEEKSKISKKKKKK
jgi:hypothetical protein